MRDFGGFEHNLQSLRVVEKLELRYADFDGLNLTFEVREGILKHCSLNNAKLLGDVGQRFIYKTSPSLEAQLTNYADEIAYNNHDIDDGLRSGLITMEQLAQVDLFSNNLALVKAKYPKLEQKRLIHETVRRMINTLVVDLCTTSEAAIAKHQPKNISDIRALPQLIGFSKDIAEQNNKLKQFLRKNLYHHYKVNRMSAKARRIVRELFTVFFDNVGLLPDEFQAYAEADKPRAVADYIAGMTDRFAIREHRKLFTVEEYL
jgi:dGTPase